MAEAWTAGERYDPFVGRWSRLVAAEFVAWLAVPPGRDWLDVGCGTGALTERIGADAAPRRLVAMDPAVGYVAHARRRVGGGGFLVGRAEAPGLRDGSFDAVVSGLVLNFVPDPDRAAGEMRRVSRSGGTVAAYVWDYADGMRMLRAFWDAAGELDPAVRALDERGRFPLCAPDALAALLVDAGLVDVETRAIDVPTVFASFDDYWTPFLGGQGPAGGYLAGLPDDARTALRELLRARLPAEADGSIPLTARAWAVRAAVPA